MEDNKNVEFVEDEIEETEEIEAPVKKKGLQKVTEFFQKPIVKKITTGIAVVGAAIIGYALGTAGGSNNEGSCEESGYLPEPESDGGCETDTGIETEADADYADNGSED